MSTKPTNPCRVKTGEVRFSYAHVFKASSMNADGSNPKFSVSILIPKEDKATLDKIEKAVQAAIVAGKDKVGDKLPKNFKYPLRDGDEEREDDPVYAGMMFLNASSTQKPTIFDESLEQITDDEDFYSGCYGRAILNFYAFNNSGNKGVAAGLQGLQKLKDGERLSGGGVTADDFADDEDELL